MQKRNYNPMPISVSMSESGLVIYNKGLKILLDPHKQAPCDVTFFSHAHTDHLLRRQKKDSRCSAKVLASKATSYLAQARGIGFESNDPEECSDGYRLLDTCHVLGSRGLLIDDKIYYTGDISTRQRAFMKGACIPEVHTLIIESTFGKPHYIFPPVADVVHTTNKIISDMFDRGVSVLLLGYPLGKAQLLTELFGHWGPLYMHDSIDKINAVYRQFGIALKQITLLSTAEENSLLSKSSPWVMIGPLTNLRTSFVKYIKAKHPIVTIGFSGWAVDNNYKFMMGLDYAMPMSDHCDFEELVEIVKCSGASKIYTFHGFSSEFAWSLKQLGFDAKPVKRDATDTRRNQRNPNSSLDLYINI